MNQRKNSGAAVLLYNLDGSERARKIKFILVRMGVRIKNIKKEIKIQVVINYLR